MLFMIIHGRVQQRMVDHFGNFELANVGHLNKFN